MSVLDLGENCSMAAVWLLLRDRLETREKLADAGVDVEFEEDVDAIRSAGDFPQDRVVVIVTGGMGPWNAVFEHQYGGALLLNFEVRIRSLDFVDVANLQTALFDAIADDPDAEFKTALCEAGAETGLVTVTRALAEAGAEKNNTFVVLTGQMAMQVNTPLYP